jgi:hypothetical protein
MTEIGPETPDAVEQAQGDAPVAAPSMGTEVPEADAVEQAQADQAEPPPLAMKAIPDDVPEADALEQAFEVPLDDDYR